jgi:hypothetical protein
MQFYSCPGFPLIRQHSRQHRSLDGEKQMKTKSVVTAVSKPVVLKPAEQETPAVDLEDLMKKIRILDPCPQLAVAAAVDAITAAENRYMSPAEKLIARLLDIYRCNHTLKPEDVRKEAECFEQDFQQAIDDSREFVLSYPENFPNIRRNAS